MKSLAGTLILLFFLQIARSQDSPPPLNKKALELYNKSMQLAQEDRFKEGIEALKEAIKIEPN